MADASAGGAGGAGAVAAAGGGADQNAGGFWNQVMPFLRMAAMWYAIQSFTGSMTPNQPTNRGNVPSTTDNANGGGEGASIQVGSVKEYQNQKGAFSNGNGKIRTYRNAFDTGDDLNLRVYVSPLEEFDFTLMNAEEEHEHLRWYLDGIHYDLKPNEQREDGIWSTEFNVSITPHLLQNGSIYAHVFLTKDGYSPNPQDTTYHDLSTIYKRLQLNAYRPRPKIVKKRNLLSSTTSQEEAEEDMKAKVEEEEEEEVDQNTYISMWKPSFMVNFVHDETVYASNLRPPPFLEPYMDIKGSQGAYLPVLMLNEFWILEDMLMPINKTMTTLPLEISLFGLPLYKFALYTQMELSFQNQQEAGASSKKDSDSMKRMFLETNPYLLAVTIFVSLLHSLFDFLAFKNDVSFWKNQKSLVGLSVRTVVLNTFFQLVIFLYLVDNETSWMILVSSFVGLIIDCWKIKKALRFTRDENNKLVIKGEDNYQESPTAEHDRVAVEHLSYIMYPLIVGYSVYKLMYGEHKGWYSWVLSSLTSFVYAFGFIMMTPQLYINYKLKSVAHLPWRAMVYKSLNTFIDDLFAFVIKMPLMHRLSCFRDDIIFFIYLYQRWIYPVDSTRTNEFGQGPAEEDKEKEQEDKQPLLEEESANSKEDKEKKEENIAEELMLEDTLSSSPATSSEYLMTKRKKTSRRID